MSNSSKISLEFGTLYSPSRNSKGDPRYPSIAFLNKFKDMFFSESVAIHLCGESVKNFFNGDNEVLDLCDFYGRVQLNFSMNDYTEEEVHDLIIESSNRNPNVPLIIQHNKSKNNLIKKLFITRHFNPTEMGTVHFLYDASGGFGKEATEFKAPFEGIYTGYAGGITPNNVAKFVNQINTVNTKNDNFYIDMESGIRVDNLFSVEKCRQIVSSFMVE